MSPAFSNTDISSFYFSDIILFLIDYACGKLCNIWLLFFENYDHYMITIQELHTRGKTLLQLLLKIG